MAAGMGAAPGWQLDLTLLLSRAGSACNTMSGGSSSTGSMRQQQRQQATLPPVEDQETKQPLASQKRSGCATAARACLLLWHSSTPRAGEPGGLCHLLHLPQKVPRAGRGVRAHDSTARKRAAGRGSKVLTPCCHGHASTAHGNRHGRSPRPAARRDTPAVAGRLREQRNNDSSSKRQQAAGSTTHPAAAGAGRALPWAPGSLGRACATAEPCRCPAPPPAALRLPAQQGEGAAWQGRESRRTGAHHYRDSAGQAGGTSHGWLAEAACHCRPAFSARYVQPHAAARATTNASGAAYLQQAKV